MQTPFTFRSLIERSVFEPHTFAEAYEVQQWSDPSGSAYRFSEFVVPIESSGTVGYPSIARYYGHPIVSWIDFFTGKCKTKIFELCMHCGSKDERYEFNLLGHPTCVHCGAEIS